MKNYKVIENFFDGSLKIVLTSENADGKNVFVNYKQALNRARMEVKSEMLWAN